MDSKNRVIISINIIIIYTHHMGTTKAISTKLGLFLKTFLGLLKVLNQA